MRIPTYRKHTSGQARVTIRGKDHMLGPFDSPESKEKYNRLIAEYLALKGVRPKNTDKLTMADVLTSYIRHAKVYYAGSSELLNMKAVVQAVRDVYGSLPADRFGAGEFQSVRAHWMKDEKRSRQHVNKCMKRTLRVIKWAVAAGMIPPEAHTACKCVEPLKKGRCGPMRESKKITCVDPALVEKTLPLLTSVQQDMVKFMQATGCRPGEMCKLQPSMFDITGNVWVVDFGEHKTAHHGLQRKLYLGSKAKAIIAPYLKRLPNQHCFSPQESERQRLAKKHADRTTPMEQGNSPGTNRIARKPRKTPGKAYTPEAFAKCIKYACKRGKLAHWHPNQLRHTYGTMIRKQFGIEAAQVMLGHACADVTQVYAERDEALALEVVQKIG